VYRRSSEAYGGGIVSDLLKNRRYPLHYAFSNAVSSGGMPRFTGLKTTVDRDKIADGQRDWMSKNL
jgi:hypothetical protein